MDEPSRGFVPHEFVLAATESTQGSTAVIGVAPAIWEALYNNL